MLVVILNPVMAIFLHWSKFVLKSREITNPFCGFEFPKMDYGALSTNMANKLMPNCKYETKYKKCHEKGPRLCLQKNNLCD